MTTPNATQRSIFQIGAAGGVGRRLTALLTKQGHRVTGMHRAGGQDIVIHEAGGTPVTGDLIDDSVATLAERLAGHDAVVFSAGAHGTGAEMTTAIDGRGLEKAADAAVTSGVRRFVLVSVFMDALRDQPRSEGFEHYMRVKPPPTSTSPARTSTSSSCDPATSSTTPGLAASTPASRSPTAQCPVTT